MRKTLAFTTILALIAGSASAFPAKGSSGSPPSLPRVTESRTVVLSPANQPTQKTVTTTKTNNLTGRTTVHTCVTESGSHIPTCD